MSGALPYPVSNNRASYSAHDHSSTFTARAQNPAYSYPSFSARNTNFETSHGRVDSSPASSSLSGMFHHEEQDPQQHLYSRVAHHADAFSGPGQPRDQVWQYPHQVSRLDHSGLDMHPIMSREYPPPLSHPPPVAGTSHRHHLANSSTTSTRPATSGSTTGRSRREKPRLELAPDQPLTTQGKPRSRVYVACVQCRGRKIRCDGAKPICHNCRRRTDNSNVCSYDVAPKRRGPDRIPGARQRSAAGSDKPRRRRRPPPLDATDQPFAAVQGTSESPVDDKSATFSPTAHSFVPNPHPHSEHLTVIHQVDPDQYGRHRQGSGRPSVAGGIGYMQHHHDPSVSSHTPAAAYEAIPLGSSMSSMSVSVDYVVGGSPMHTIQGSEDEYDYEDNVDQKGAVIAAEPGLQFARATWWDALLVLYANDDRRGPSNPVDVTVSTLRGGRENTVQRIHADLRSIFRASPHWLNFINLPRFFASLLDPRARHSIQPSLIIGALALATFFRSHEGGLAAEGRERALRLRDQAQSALEASWSARWIDHSLVQAAWLLAFFEICAHPLHSTTRVRSAMGLLDSLIRTMNFLSLDLDDPRASVFTSAVPVVPTDSPRRLSQPSSEEFIAAPIAQSPTDKTSMGEHWRSPNTHLSLHPQPDAQHDGKKTSPLSHLPSRSYPHAHVQDQSSATKATCNCLTFTLGHTWPMVREFAPLWDMTPTWQSEWTESDIRKEECRRLVWSSVMLSAGHSSYTAASSDIETQQLYLMDPRNYALLFPGESLTRADDSPAVPPPAKDSVWALYMRAMLLWNSCIRMRADLSLPDAEKAQFASSAWTEIDAIEEALGRHSCDIERSFLFQGRELLFNSRMCIAYEFQRCLPQSTTHVSLLLYRQKAEEWLTHQASLAKRVLDAGLSSVTGLAAANLAKRPFLLFWFMSQIERALTLWSYDNSLALALDVAKVFRRPVEYLMTLWPCPEQRRRWEELLDRLNSCLNSVDSTSSEVSQRSQELPSVPTQAP